MEGIRSDYIPAACELTWQYFYSDGVIPRVVKLLSDYDTWSFRYGEETKLLQEGIKLENTYPDSFIWKDLLSRKASIYELLLKQGELAIRYRDNYSSFLVKNYSFEVEFEGHKGVVCNAGKISLDLFNSVRHKDYDLFITIIFDGDQWTVSLYSEWVNCREIAQKHGGLKQFKKS